MTITSVSLIKKPSKTMVGPFAVSAVDDYVRAKLVVKEGVPITLYETKEDGTERYAVLAPPGKEMRVVCVGCFQPGMSLFDDSRCKKISSYCQHWDNNKGVRKHSCKTTHALQECELRLVDHQDDAGTESTEAIDLTEVDTEILVNELVKRNSDFKYILPKVEEKDLVQAVKDRGIKILGECVFRDLEPELRRVTDPVKPTYQSFYAKSKKEGRSHYTDRAMVTDDIKAAYWSGKRTNDTEGPEISKRAKYNTRSTSN
jgi:hypothetical protein